MKRKFDKAQEEQIIEHWAKQILKQYGYIWELVKC